MTSMDADGTKAGYDIELTRAVSEAVHVPVIASGGAGSLEHLVEVLGDWFTGHFSSHDARLHHKLGPHAHD